MCSAGISTVEVAMEICHKFSPNPQKYRATLMSTIKSHFKYDMMIKTRKN